MRLEICHTTRYRYGDNVSDSVNELRLAPRTDERQACYHHTLAIDPNVSLLSYEDYFGNRVHSFTAYEPHRELVITSRSTVVTRDSSYSRVPDADPYAEWAKVRSAAFVNANAEYLLPTVYASFHPNVAAYAHGIGGDEGGVYGFALEATRRINEDFEYKPQSTGVQTTSDELIGLGAGVCQDFAHLMLSVCRIRGVAARYVSGYHYVGDLQGRGADFEQASHAWVEAYVPGVGWQGFDPTNNGLVDWRYIKLAHGRDYLDIVPVKGIYRGTGEQELLVTVDVRLAAG
ncbi:transglutaminase family protein [Cohnella lubricantis]|uniref:Transglutaminase family protein n=1 Tax=Cohnella lubricantis TaxID=2163172 RepID=A0A841T9J0_9BACL|nr:transglutaminase family protein [Cohnella lubricantis]MBB6676719.1 transglutaminase family protein [Cohnella lubricantis]MBP2117765.1 transglutaminase-like putative cysteine protease [Cohnella lubricantis]